MAADPLRDELEGFLGAAFTVERELGGGGMSRVFVALDTRLDRRVVVKVLLPELAQGISAERFAREIKLAAQLQEPHIVPVLVDGVTPNGLAFYMMPFVAGESLRARLQRGPASIGEGLGILRDVARALAYAHSRGVVHRDIKPENVLLSEGTAVVSDFGIAKAIAASTAHAGRGAEEGEGAVGGLTRTGTSIGTPAYMSPEQAAGGAVDQRTDVYAWGILAYELLCGHHPFSHHVTPERLLTAHFTEDASAGPLQKAGVSEEVTRLVLRCLEKDPERRPSSATEILASLGSADQPGVRARQRISMRWEAVAIVAGIVVLVASGIAMNRSRRARTVDTDAIHSLAVLPFENIGGDSSEAYLAHGITNELAVTLGRLPDIRVAPGVSARVLQSRGLTVVDLARSLSVQGVLTGTVRRGGDRLRVTAELVDGRSGDRVWSDQFEAGSANVFEVEDQITRAIVAALRPRLFAAGNAPQVTAHRGTADPEAYDLYMRGRYFWSLRSEDGMHRAIDYFSRASGRDSDYVLAISGLADAYAVSAWYSYVNPRDGYGRAKDLARRALRLDSTRAEPHASLGYVALYYDWDRAEAERQFKRAIELDSTYATAYQWYGNYLVVQNRADEAIASLRRAQRADPLNRVSVGAVCWGMAMMRRYHEAVAQCGQAIELDSTFAVARLWKGQALEMLGDSSAVRELETAVRLSGRSAVFVAALAHAYARAGQQPRARALLAELTSPRQRYVPSYEIAQVYAALGSSPDAFTWLERAYTERSHSIAFLRVDAALDPIRSDPRFTALLARADQPSGDPVPSAEFKPLAR